jgi:alkaline phosphatase D
VKFAFVSCQNANQGAQNAYRRMIFEDERAPEQNRLGFVLHLGDFIYEIVWYPEDRPQGMYDRRIRDIVRYAHGEKVADFHYWNGPPPVSTRTDYLSWQEVSPWRFRRLAST